MKKLFEPYELSRTELEIFKELTRSPASISELAERVGKSPPSAMEAVEKLQVKGFADFERHGNKKIVMLSQAKHAQLLRELFLTSPHISWQDLLSFSGILPLFELENVTPEAASRTTQWRALRNMMAHGIITKDGDKVKINPRFQKVEEFIQEFQNYNNSRLAALASEAAVIVWSRGSRFIIRVPLGTRIPDPRFKPTATTVLPRYGISLISNVEYYFLSPSPETLGPEDVVLHTVLVDGVTNVTYALILMMKTRTDRNYLLRTAEKYHLRPQVEGMLRFLDTRRPQAGLVLPKWDEFAEKAREYGVNI